MALSQADFRVLVEDHAPAMYRLAYRLVGDAHTAEDVVQDTLRSAWQSRHRFDQSRGMRAWLAAILRRRAIDRWRREGHWPAPAGERSLDIPVEGADPLASDYTDRMQRALERLPDELRESILLVVVGELTHQEAANALGVPLGTVLSRVSRARGRLRQQLMESARAESLARTAPPT